MLPGATPPRKRPGNRATISIRTCAGLLIFAAFIFLISAAALHLSMVEETDDSARALLPGATRASPKRLAKSLATAVSSVKARAMQAAKATAAATSDRAAATAAAAVQTAKSVESFRSLIAKGAANRRRANELCRDQNENCAMWAKADECTANPGFMRPNCPKSCDACMDAVRKQNLCHRPREKVPLLRRGGISATFERVVAMAWDMGLASPEVIVHSRPPRGPWLITIDNFLAEHEIRALMDKGGHHFERSLAGDGVSPVRTSKTSWCNVPFCESDPVIRAVKVRVANVTGVPLANSEHVQVLQYDPGDFYRTHHDQNAATHSPWGPRLFTFFTYLSTVPEGGGGGTRFTHLNVTVEAKRGRAVFWPSVHDHDPSAIREHSDPRTTHEALTVTRGQKFAANMWLHQFDFQNSLAAGCRNEDQAEWRPSSPEDADSDPPREEPEPPE